MKIFLAGPFFTDGERCFMKKIKNLLVQLGNDVISPIDIGFEKKGSEEIFKKDLEEITKRDILVAILDGLDAGTMCEIGYAKRKAKKIIGIWTHKEKELDPFVKWMCDEIVRYEDLKRTCSVAGDHRGLRSP